MEKILQLPTPCEKVVAVHMYKYVQVNVCVNMCAYIYVGGEDRGGANSIRKGGHG